MEVRKIMEWIKVNSPKDLPMDGSKFLVIVWDNWVGFASYARHYDADDRCPGKYDFFYICDDPEKEGFAARVESNDFPITHWMPLPDKPS